jgi:hypothetical protein
VVKPVSIYWLSCTDEVPTRDGPEGGGGGQGKAGIGVGGREKCQVETKKQTPSANLVGFNRWTP